MIYHRERLIIRIFNIFMFNSIKNQHMCIYIIYDIIISFK